MVKYYYISKVHLFILKYVHCIINDYMIYKNIIHTHIIFYNNNIIYRLIINE